MRQHSHNRRAIALIAAALVVCLSGCGIRKPQVTELLWPPPPLTARIKFVGLLQNEDDLGRPLGEVMAEAIVGRRTAADAIERPMSVAPSRDGTRLYVSDYEQARVVVFDFENRRMESLADPTAPFVKPFGVAVDADDNVYVVDSAAKLVRVFDAQKAFRRNIEATQFERPTGIAVDSPNGRIYVVDSSRKDSLNHVVHVLAIDGTYLTSLGGQGTDEGKFFFPTYVTIDSSGNLYVTDTLNSRVQVLDPSGTHLKTIGKMGDGFGMFHKPKGVALDRFGNVYVVDSVWSNVQIFNPKGEVLLYFAGRGGIPGLLNNPTGIAIDAQNRIYVADSFNARVAIYELVNTESQADSYASPQDVSEKGGSYGVEFNDEQRGGLGAGTDVSSQRP